MNIETAVDNIREARRKLLQLLDGIPEESLGKPGLIDHWSIRDLLAHISAWDKACLIPLSGFVHARPWSPDVIENHDLWNSGQVEKRRILPLQEVLSELIAVREDLLSTVEEVPQERLDDILEMPWGDKTNFAGMISGLAWHENEHLKEIKEALAHL